MVVLGLLWAMVLVRFGVWGVWGGVGGLVGLAFFFSLLLLEACVGLGVRVGVWGGVIVGGGVG